MERTEKLERELKKLAGIEGVLGSAIIARNGMVIAEELPEGVDERRVAAMAATLMASIETLASTLGRGLPKLVHTELERSSIVVLGLSAKAFLLTILARDINLEQILPKLEENIERLKKIIIQGVK